MNLMVGAHGLWFEGNREFLRVMAPHPILLRAYFPGEGQGGAEMLFREDYFNSVTRIRRGRLYQKPDGTLMERMQWADVRVSWAPYQNLVARTSSVFEANDIYETMTGSRMLNRDVVLGDRDGQSYWQVVLSEKTSDAHYLTLKSKTYFGVLPEVNRDTIPEANRQDILRALDAVVEAAPIQAPQPVIDACRNAAYHMITAKFPESNSVGKKELGELVKWLLEEGRLKSCTEAANAIPALLEASSSHLISRLHSRAKPNAAAQHGTRPVSQQDANLAVDAIAFLLQDFGWAGTT